MLVVLTGSMDKLKTWLEQRGRVTELAKACGITHSAVLQWTRVPPEHAMIVERVTGIPCHELRPDVFPVAKKGRAA